MRWSVYRRDRWESMIFCGGRAQEETARIEADTLGLMCPDGWVVCPEPLPQEEFVEGQAGGSERRNTMKKDEVSKEAITVAW